jgi:RNA polymerase sigma-70 factor (ECF subfamily)
MTKVHMVATTEQLWHGLHDRLLRSIRRHVADAASAEDILQEVFLKIPCGSARCATRSG